MVEKFSSCIIAVITAHAPGPHKHASLGSAWAPGTSAGTTPSAPN